MLIQQPEVTSSALKGCWRGVDSSGFKAQWYCGGGFTVVLTLYCGKRKCRGMHMNGRRQIAEKNGQHRHCKNKCKESAGAKPEFVAGAWPFRAVHGSKETNQLFPSTYAPILSGFLSVILDISDPYPDLIYLQHTNP